MKNETSSLIAAVKAHAIENYDNGWDVVIETFTDSEIAEQIEGSTTAADAISQMREYVELYSEAREAAVSEIF